MPTEIYYCLKYDFEMEFRVSVMCYLFHISVLRLCSPQSTLCSATNNCALCEDAALMWRA
jgi:hypothetical protein